MSDLKQIREKVFWMPMTAHPAAALAARPRYTPAVLLAALAVLARERGILPRGDFAQRFP